MQPPSPYNIVHNKHVKLSIAVEFFICALFWKVLKTYKFHLDLIALVPIVIPSAATFPAQESDSTWID